MLVAGRAIVKLMWVIGPALLLAVAHPALASSLTPVKRNDQPAMRAVIRDLCHRDVAVIGEATHSDGHTETFKVALVERLVSRCGFRAVVFEASLYEFLAFNRARREGHATEAMVGDAIGGLWKFETEFKPLTHFLYIQAAAGRITLGGMDDQLGGLEQPFANDAMTNLLSEGLPADIRAACVDALHRRTHWDYDDAHSEDANRTALRSCLAEMRKRLPGLKISPLDRAGREAMLDGVDRQVARDALSSDDYAKDRDRAMYGEFARFAARLSKGTRIIVWTQSFHAAKSPAIRPDEDDAPTFGTLLHQTYGRRAFALAFSARSGSYHWDRKENRTIPPPPPGALELAAAAGGETAYLDSAALQTRGVAPAAPDYHTYRSARWADIFDGLVIFAEEHPPHSTRVYSSP